MLLSAACARADEWSEIWCNLGRIYNFDSTTCAEPVVDVLQTTIDVT